MNTISPVRPPSPSAIDGIQPAGRAGAVAPGAGASFRDVMAQSISKVNGLQHAAHSTALRFLQGEPVEVHQVALEQQRAAMAFDLLLEARNKVISAYQEVMRMPL